MKQNKTFTVYFEIFGLKKKYIVDNNNVKDQSEAEQYVKNVLIPSNIKIYYLNNENSSKNKSNIFNESFKNFIKEMNRFFEKK